MSNYIEVRRQEEFEQHECEGVREGNWIVYRCSQCSYERRFNQRTGKMEVTPGNPDALHRGEYRPVGLNLFGISGN